MTSAYFNFVVVVVVVFSRVYCLVINSWSQIDSLELHNAELNKPDFSSI